MTTATKQIVLCADDFGQDLTISQGIADLLTQGLLSATSCMTTTSAWPESARLLKPLIGQVDIGLHLNLTEGDAIDHVPTVTRHVSFPKLSILLAKAYCDWLSVDAILREFRRQLENFRTVMGRLPDFIDGHQHVHHFPIVRDALRVLYQTDLQGHACYVRSVWSDVGEKSWKSRMIRRSGAKALAKQLQRDAMPHNASFAGIYDFSADPKVYPQKMATWLTNMTDQGLLMCHPALPDPEHVDVIAAARAVEYQYLASDAFAQLLTEQQVELARFSLG